MDEEKQLCREHVERAILECENISTVLKRVYREVDRLTAELAAKDEWTPITSVEQVEGLAAGLYLLDSDMLGVKWKDGHWHFMIYSDHEFRFADADINKSFDSYKLIRAFEPAAPSIPEGAIENTLENRRGAIVGDYIFTYSNGLRNLAYKSEDDDWYWKSDILSSKTAFLNADYFTKISGERYAAALEALAKGEQS